MNSILIQLRALWHSRELIAALVSSDLKVAYKSKFFGFFWTILDPLMMMGVYILLVRVIFKRGGPQFPILLFCALLSWKWFTSSLSESVVAITARAKLIQAVFFPKVALPFSKVLAGLIEYLFSLSVLIPLLFIFKAEITFMVLWLPALVFVQLLFTVGISLLCSCLGVYFRDFQNIIRYFLRFWFYLSPALYSVYDRIPVRFRHIYMLNPFASLFVSYKNTLVRGKPPTAYIVVLVIAALAVLIVGLLIFDRKEKQFARDV
jgi:ABC-type polysaccharide/polyol phosphate export permease